MFNENIPYLGKSTFVFLVPALDFIGVLLEETDDA